MAVNGRAKGAGFELRVAKLFSEAMGVKLRRTPMSGGWSHDNPEVTGDLVCVEGNFPFCVECKCEEGWRLESLFAPKHTWFDNYWAQLKRECPADKIPLLVFSRARQPIFVAFYMSTGMWQGLSATGTIYLNSPDGPLVITLLEDLLYSIRNGLVTV